MLFVSYWFDKYMLITFCRRPPIYNEDLIMKILNMVQYAILIHMIFGIFIFSNSDIFPDYALKRVFLIKH